MKKVEDKIELWIEALDAELRRQKKPLVVVLTGAGVSAESGIPTFRDANGLWEGHDVLEVASPKGWARNPELVLRFYNLRRKAAFEAQPNSGHLALRKLEEKFTVVVVTQNVDDLHEKAGSRFVLHLHGELSKVRSVADEQLIYDIGGAEIQLGDVCEKGAQLRPHIVWFGEEVPMISVAYDIARQADYFMVIGTSLQVYPAADLIHFAPKTSHKYVIDKKIPPISARPAHLHLIEAPASIGTPQVVEQLLAQQ